jgi:hypothetical protein
MLGLLGKFSSRNVGSIDSADTEQIGLAL